VSPTRPNTLATLALLALPLSAVAGCATCSTCDEPLASYSYRHQGPCYYGPMMCFGYHSTCWRPWPEECPPCPPYTLTPELAESVAPPMPQATPLPPPGSELPLPMPAVPSPSDRGYYSTPDDTNLRPHVEVGFASQPVRLAPPESH
jgi:hypothetical protein